MGKRTYVRSGGSWVDVTTGAVFPASSNPPSTPSSGQVYFDTDDLVAYIYNGTSWVALGDATISTAQTLSNKTLVSPVVTGILFVDNAASLPASLSNATGTIAQFVNQDGDISRFVIDAHGTGAFSAYTARASRGTAASPTATQINDKIGELGARGYGATDWAAQSQGRMVFYAGENWTDSAQGVYAVVELAPNGAISTDNALVIRHNSLNIPSGSSYKINDVSVVNATTLGSGVTGSSLTSVGTISSGTWQGGPVAVLYGGTGATTEQSARTNLLPSQTGNANKFLKTDGTDVAWAVALTSIANETIDGGGA
jgi:hypothetical protein